MRRERIRLGPGVPDLAALGAGSERDLFDADGAPLGFDRARVVSDGGRDTLIRYPLPGTPDESGRFREPPRGAGTGYVYLRRYRGAGLVEAVAARLTAPPSESLAEREWNLVCHLRAHGVGTPDLLAVGSRPAGAFARRSFLVTRELRGMTALADWARLDVEPLARRRGAIALGKVLLALFRCGGWLPRLSARHVFLSSADAGVPGARDCAAEEIHDLRAAADARKSGAPRRNRLPSVVLCGFERGRILTRVGGRRRGALLARLDREAPLAPRERLRVFSLATRDLGRAERRAALRRALGRP